jgi:hypothetical protein
MVIPIRIPIGVNYTSIGRDTAIKQVKCEQCDSEYVYQMTRSAQGSGLSLFFADNEGAQERAAQRAQEAVREKLLTSCDPVPCPACGWYQQYMVPRARYLRYKWMGTAALSAPLVAIILMVVAGFLTALHAPTPPRVPFLAVLLAWVLVGLSLTAAPGFLFARSIIRRRYDPNLEDVDRRKKLGQDRAMSKEAFLKMIQDNQA